MVITASANAVVSKKGRVAYNISKAASHLVRALAVERALAVGRALAVELVPLVRVSGVAPATVVQGSAMFPRDRVIASLAKYALPCSEGETHDVLQGRLAAFYADRTLTKTAITPADQAEAIFLLLSDRHKAFLR